MTKAKLPAKKEEKAVPEVSYCYIRERRPDRGSHRIACIALRKAPLGYFYLSYYVHNPKRGAFNPAYARATAIGRLKSPEKVQRVFHDLFLHNAVVDDKLSQRVLTETGLKRRLDQAQGRSTSASLDHARNDRAIRGALLELEPRKMAHPAIQ